MSLENGLREVSTAELVQASEQETIQRVLQGETNAFRFLVEAHQNQVYAIIIRQVADAELAHELTQETFLRAYTKLKSFQGKSSFGTWLIRIALNQASSYFSSKAYKQKMKTTHFDVPSHEATLALDSFDQDAIRYLQYIIGLLKPKQREVLVLCGLEQKSYQEVSDILDIPVGTVRSRLNKARNKARELYFSQQKHEA